MSEKQLPNGWALAELEQVLDYQQPSKYIVESTEYSDRYPVPVLTAGKTFIIGYTNESDGVFEDGLPVIIFDDFTTATQYVNFKFKVKSSAMKILLPHSSEVNLKFLFYLMQTIHIQNDTHKRYWISQYSKIKIPFAPWVEQQRIVDKIEELFSDLDSGVANLQKVKQQLKTYRQAVLKDAFEGKLTEQWRKDNIKDKIDLLTRAREDRDLKAKNAKEKKLKYSWPNGINLELTYIPSEWQWAQIGDISWSIKDGPHYSPQYEDDGIPFITGGNVRPDGVDFKHVKYISNELHRELCKRCKPELGDILYTKGGTTGIARVNTYDIEFNVWVHVAVLKLCDDVLPFYIQHCLNSQFCYAQSQNYTHGVGNQDLGLTRLINIVFPLCNIEEQHQVVYEIESRLSVCNKIEQTVDETLQKAENLRQSILKKAFEGKLVPQNPEDEPAEKLLKRIKEQTHARK